MNPDQQLHFGEASDEAKAKLAELILYIADRCQSDERFGSTKLNKVLWFADSSSYRQRGRSITNCQYQRLPRGPAPKHLLPVQRELESSGALVVKHQSFFDKRVDKPIALRRADLTGFSAEDIATVDRIIDQLRDANATEVSEMSHGIAWRSVEEGELIPYEASILAEPEVTPAIRRRASELASRYGW